MASENSKQTASGITAAKQTSLSSKKVLPPTPAELSSSSVPVDRNASLKQNQAYSGFFLEYSLISEYLLLQKQLLSGVYVIPSAGSPLKWFGVIFIRQGLYQGGVFRFTLYVPDNYPDCECPILVFDPPVFNPLINAETGELDVKRAFPKWRRNVNHLWQVIQYAKRIFYKIETECPLNFEAAELYEKDLELYKVRAAESISLCNDRLYEKPNTDDPHAFYFTPWDPSIHEDFRKKLFSYKAMCLENGCLHGELSEGNWLIYTLHVGKTIKTPMHDEQAKEEHDHSKNSQTGLSWMQPGNLQIFSKTVS